MPSTVQDPWPWYIAGPLIGLTVPALLLLGNKAFGISSNLRHLCAVCFPAKIPYFQYDYKSESWNLWFAAGIMAGAFLAMQFLHGDGHVAVAPALQQELSGYGINYYSSQVPVQLYNWPALLTLRGWLLLVGGGFLVGFGTRYANGCTSGHSIFGLSTLQWPSLVATVCFMLGGFLMANYILPVLLRL